MGLTWDQAMARHRAALEAATGRTAGEAQLRAARALCEAVTGGRRAVTRATVDGDAPLIAALAATALAEDDRAGGVDVVMEDGQVARRLKEAFRTAGLDGRVRVAEAATLAFDYLKAGRAGPTPARVAVVADGGRTLLDDDHTPVVLAASPTESPDAATPEAREEADRTLRNGRDYVVEEDRVVPRDPATGALFPGRRFTRGLHAAVEEREGLPPTAEGEPLAEIRLGDYFRRYPSLVAVAGPGESTRRYAALYGMEAG